MSYATALLAHEMVRLEDALLAAVRERQWRAAQDIEEAREIVATTRFGMLRQEQVEQAA